MNTPNATNPNSGTAVVRDDQSSRAPYVLCVLGPDCDFTTEADDMRLQRKAEIDLFLSAVGRNTKRL